MYGQLGHIGIARETAWGTAVAATDYMKGHSEGLTLAIDRYEQGNIVARLYAPDDAAGVKRSAGDIVIPAYPESIGYFLNSVFGVNSVTEVLSGFLHTHVFTMTNSNGGVDANCPVPSYTIEMNRGQSSSQQYTGVAVSALSIDIQPNQDVRFNATCIAKSTTDIEKTTPSFPSSSATPFAFDTCSISLGGAANAKLEALSINIDNLFGGVPTLNNTSEIAKIKRDGSQKASISGTIEFDNITEYNLFKNQTEQALVVSLTKADSFSLVLDMPRVVYTAAPLGVSGRDRLTLALEGMVRYHMGSAQALEVRLTTINSYF